MAETLPPNLVAGAQFDDTPGSIEDAVAKVTGPCLSTEEALLQIVMDVRQQPEGYESAPHSRPSALPPG